MRRLLATMIASEVERIRAPERVSESAAADFLRAVLGRELSDREALLARAKELSLEVEGGASMIVARAHPQALTDDGWRGRVRAVAERGARASMNRSIAALSEREGVLAAEVVQRPRRHWQAQRHRGGDGAAADSIEELVLAPLDCTVEVFEHQHWLGVRALLECHFAACDRELSALRFERARECVEQHEASRVGVCDPA